MTDAFWQDMAQELEEDPEYARHHLEEAARVSAVDTLRALIDEWRP